ncbi:hypothetical protein [Maritimibacter sp. UBA3975]|uniref:hypothetical protein n=1 Tax=Maritimibacter sp. UBA3975 TaxID=1946833 RepID=UPI000C0AA4EE|nr:hypothetical protein [Maritimibacter sp. UBA3975]MAM63780.1 hypothetical protein [Maritimibacter sp.]|tara:strand:+ start:1613 stop:1906 length:294 start_codon:yes stop_codon:yes gene_type:complete
MTRLPIMLLATLPLALAACDMPQTTAGAPQGTISELPERVLEIAAPGQNLSAVRVNEVDGCYEYQYRGPVETTYLPLRASSGRPICTRAPGEAPAAS